MKYTKAFEKYWSNFTIWNHLDLWQWEEIKRVAFRAWKAGIKHEKERY